MPLDLFAINRPLSPLRLAWREFHQHPVLMASLYTLFALIIISAAAPWLAPFGMNEQQRELLLQPPAWVPGGTFAHFLGTDDLGRDILSLLIHGARYTFGAALVTISAAAFIGMSIGVLAGMTRGMKSSILLHVLDTTLSIPSLLLAISIIALFGVGLWPVLAAVLFSQIPQFIRSTHLAVSRELAKPYVAAARLDGQRGMRLFFTTLLPNLVEAFLMQFFTSLSTAILDIAALGFLRLGAQSPQSEWGALLSNGLEHLYHSPWMVALPGLTLLFTVLAVHIVAEGTRHAMDKTRGWKA